MSITLSKEQEAAVDLAVNSSFQTVAITGPAGTGKSTILKEIVQRLNGQVFLCSFTGKAANRMMEASGHQATTIHRMLGYNGIRFTVKKLSKVVIIDEASMVDSALLAAIIRATPPKIVLIGDESQLEPINIGAAFRDFLKYYPKQCIHLTKSYRSSAAIYKATMSIRNGMQPSSSDQSGGETFKVIQTKSTRATMETLETWLRTPGFWDPHQDIILSAVNDKPGGVKELNNMMAEIFNPGRGEEKFLVGDRVINLKNDSENSVWNGDCGTIYGAGHKDSLYIKLDRDHPDGEICFTKAMQKNLALAYCISVHRAQGAQFRKVFFVCLKHHRFSVSRSLIYTALTRATKASAVIGNAWTFLEGIERTVEKKTIIQFLKEVQNNE